MSETKLLPFVAGEGDLYNLAFHVRAWLRRHLETHTEHREPKGYSKSVTGTDGWAVVAIPDWDVKQRLDEMDAAIAAWNTRPSDPRIAAAQGVVDALKAMLSEKADYMIRNHLGDPNEETVSQQATTALDAWEKAQ